MDVVDSCLKCIVRVSVFNYRFTSKFIHESWIILNRHHDESEDKTRVKKNFQISNYDQATLKLSL